MARSARPAPGSVTPVKGRSEVPDRSEVPEDARRREWAGRMGRMIAALPAREREVLVLRLVRRLSVEETAETLRSTPTGVLIAQHQALDRLRSSIARSGGGS